MSTLFDLLKQGAIKPVIADALPLSSARDVHERIALQNVAAKIALLPLGESERDGANASRALDKPRNNRADEEEGRGRHDEGEALCGDGVHGLAPLARTERTCRRSIVCERQGNPISALVEKNGFAARPSSA
jgi:hypothetical protein